MKDPYQMTRTEELAATPMDYETTIRVKASPDALFDAVTALTGLAAWWNPATGSGESGGELRFVMNAPEPLVIHVDDATRPASVRWTVTDCPFLPDWIGTRPTFTITPVDGQTTELHFRHHGLNEELECINACTRSRNHYMTSLRDYVEVGRGSPLGSPADKARRDAQARMAEMSIHQEAHIDASPPQVFALLTSGSMFSAATGQPAEITDREGDSFSLFGGRVEGRQIELVEGERVVQAWRFGTGHPSAWQPGVYSTVRFALEPAGHGTRLVIDHAGIPAEWIEHISLGYPDLLPGSNREVLCELTGGGAGGRHSVTSDRLSVVSSRNAPGPARSPRWRSTRVECRWRAFHAGAQSCGESVGASP